MANNSVHGVQAAVQEYTMYLILTGGVCNLLFSLVAAQTASLGSSLS